MTKSPAKSAASTVRTGVEPATPYRFGTHAKAAQAKRDYSRLPIIKA
jgi:hypothetical protein